MLVQLLNKIYTYTQFEKLNSETHENTTQNPFVFTNFKLWEQAERYIVSYIKEEVDKLVEGKQEVIYTNREDMVFSRVNAEIDKVLDALIQFLNRQDELQVSACDRAYLECKLYNDIEEEIIVQAIKKIFIKKEKWMNLNYYLFTRKLKRFVNQGEKIALTELKVRVLGKQKQYVA